MRSNRVECTRYQGARDGAGKKKTQPGKMSLGGPFTRAVSGPAREVMKAPQRRRLVFDGNKSDVAGI